MSRGAATASHAYRTLLRQHHPDTRAPSNDPQDTADDQARQQVLAAYKNRDTGPLWNVASALADAVDGRCASVTRWSRSTSPGIVLAAS